MERVTNFCKKYLIWFGYIWSLVGGGLILSNYRSIDWTPTDVAITVFFVIAVLVGNWLMFLKVLELASWLVDQVDRIIKERRRKKWL